MPTEAGTCERQAGVTGGSLPFAIGLGTMFLAAHVSGVNAVFPLIAAQLGIDVLRGQWILTAYTLALSGCLLAFGSLGDRIGFKRVYIAGMAVYGISSGGCALAHGAEALVLLRSVQGIGAAMVSATSVALIGVHVPRWRLGRAVGWQTGITYTGLALGPMAAGYVMQRYGWRAVFAMNVPAAVVAIAATLGAPAEPGKIAGNAGGTAGPGYLSSLAWIAGLVTLMIALGGGGGQVYAAACAAVFVSLFVWVERRGPEPLLRLQVFRDAEFSAATAGETVYYLCLYAIGFLMPLYLIRGRGFSAAQMGIFMGSQGAARAIAAPFSGYLSDRLGVRLLTYSGILFLTAALCCMYSFGVDTPATSILATLVLMGTGAGLFAPANSKALLGAAPAAQYGASTGILATARNVGMTLGVGAAALLYSAFGGGAGSLATLTAVRPAFAVIAGIAILYAVVGIPAPRLGELMSGLYNSDHS